MTSWWRTIAGAVAPYQFWILSGASGLYAALLFRTGWSLYVLIPIWFFTSPWSLRLYFAFYRQRHLLDYATNTLSDSFRARRDGKEVDLPKFSGDKRKGD